MVASLYCKTKYWHIFSLKIGFVLPLLTPKMAALSEEDLER
jgi:hypothetical protein